MKPTKHKVLSIKTNIRSVLVDEKKPDKRYSVGYRKTGVKLPKLGVDTMITISGDPSVRIFCFVEVVQFGQMRVVDIQKNGNILLKSTSYSLQDNFNLEFSVDDYIDVLPLGLMYGEGSK